MSIEFSLPTKILLDQDCVKKNAALLKNFGKKALIVTGRRSAKMNGSLQDVIEALRSQKLDFVIYDHVDNNPSIDNVRDGSVFAKKNKVDFIIGIGGGSPMDASKAIALLACQNLTDEALFTGPYIDKVLPLVLLPTTAGTGSEVTQYSILTNDHAQSKTSIATPLIFPKLALVDPRYTRHLPLRTTINTAIDALSHAIESDLSKKANALTKLIAEESIRRIALNFKFLLRGELGDKVREELIYASTLAGIAIAHTGTTAVHSMGYSLTYFKHIDHGRANGLLLASFLAFVAQKDGASVDRLLSLMKVQNLKEFRLILAQLLGEKEKIADEEFKKYAEIAIKAKNISNCTIIPVEEDLYGMYRESFNEQVCL
ncbi:MAG TPA: alcohol dehydrogenase [Ruminococcaceae bacterium]|nr:alcohol dehydrogenase [Oscillospiraceae bacterium]